MESDFEIIISLAVSVVVLIYLLYTLIKPEKF
ncbi:MAG: K(+)-transporting ATPase subunit F [Ignavibacteriales bacterium]|nr:K(+)-transporting ATPase subunit F [Ignavibacteriales bacterium]